MPGSPEKLPKANYNRKFLSIKQIRVFLKKWKKFNNLIQNKNNIKKK